MCYKLHVLYLFSELKYFLKGTRALRCLCWQSMTQYNKINISSRVQSSLQIGSQGTDTNRMVHFIFKPCDSQKCKKKPKSSHRPVLPLMVKKSFMRNYCFYNNTSGTFIVCYDNVVLETHLSHFYFKCSHAKKTIV